MSSITILKPGIFTSIQDLGRFGFRRFGIPLAGFMDQYSAGLANMILNKPYNAAVLEFFHMGPEIHFNDPLLIVITGADMSPAIAGIELKMNSIISIQKGDVLKFSKLKYGAISYIAFNKEIDSEIVLGSKSYSKGITSLSKCHALQTIFFEDNETGYYLSSGHVKPKTEHFYLNTLEAFKGPEFELLSLKNIQLLLQSTFKISSAYNRMGFRLEGPPLLSDTFGSMISSAVMPGTIQLTPGGQLIVLMNDCQTTGGYPRILQLDQQSLNRLAQKKAGDEIRIIFKEKD